MSTARLRFASLALVTTLVTAHAAAGDSRAALAKARAAFDESDFDAAADAYQLAIDGGHLAPGELAEAFVRVGLAFASQGKSKKALDAFRLAVIVDANVAFPSGVTCAHAFHWPPVDQVVSETLRLYPPGWLFARSPKSDDEVDGFAIPKDSFVFVSAWVVHRNEKLWPRAGAFEPARFATPPDERYAYFPFSGGPRQCIGIAFAEMEMHAILTRIAQRFTWEPLGPVPGIDPKVTLRPRGEVRLRLRDRTAT